VFAVILLFAIYPVLSGLALIERLIVTTRIWFVFIMQLTADCNCSEDFRFCQSLSGFSFVSFQITVSSLFVQITPTLLFNKQIFHTEMAKLVKSLIRDPSTLVSCST